MAFDQLHSAIMALPDTGPAGFEGFVRDVLAELTGQGFRLMKSGPQGGVDFIGDPFGSGLVIGLEGKQYAATTHLALDALKSKLRDAAKNFPAMDLWLLATTRAIDGGNTQALSEIGDELGVDVLVLDWSDAGAVPPALAVICAAAPAAISHHLGTGVASDLAAIASNTFFQSEVDRLRKRLRNPAIGFAAARDAVRAWAVKQMQDPTSARVAFDSYASLEAPKTIRIDRPAVQQALDGWWHAGPGGPTAVLGQEGMGKTWAALSWWLTRSADNAEFPLTLVIPARDVSSIDGPELLAAALYGATGVRDQLFWQRRLERWLSTDQNRPLLLVIIDGLNQNWSFQVWSDLLLSLNTAERRDKIATVLTCRPEHWKRHLKELTDSRLPITTVDVQPFSDIELDDLLAAHGLERKDLHPKLVDLMRVPRLSGIAIERRDELQEGEVTPERLVFEDWRYRHHGAQRAMSHEEFRTFIGKLGRELNDQLGGTVERKALFERLSTDGPSERDKLEAVFSELTEGGWLKPSAEPGHFKLDADRVPAALGLALLDDVRAGDSPEQRAEILGQLLDPLQGSDLSVAILKNAATFAIIDKTLSAEVKRELLEAWLQSQNFSPLDFQSYWRLIGYAPSLFVDIAEEEWFGREPAGRSDEVLVKGFANAIKWPEVAASLDAKLLEWFSRYWLDRLEGEILGRVENDEAAKKRRREGAERAAAAKEEGVAETFGVTLREVEPARQAWGCYRADDARLRELLSEASTRLGPPEPGDTFDVPRFMARYALNLLDRANWLKRDDGAFEYVSPEDERQHLNAIHAERANDVAQFGLEAQIDLALEDKSKSTADLASRAVAHAKDLQFRNDQPEDVLRSLQRRIVSAAMIAARDGDDSFVTSEEAWIRTVLKSAFAEPNTDVATGMRNGIRFNPVAIAAVGVGELWRRFSKVEDRDWLLEVASRPDSYAREGLAAAITLIRSSDERLVRSILRVAFASQIQPERKWDEEEGDGVNADRQKSYQRRVSEALVAERGWLDGGREEPSWPKFPLGKRYLRNAGRSKFVDDDDFEPESEGDTFVASQSCARWLRLMTGDEAQTDIDWLPTLIAAYEPWTLHANGAGLHPRAQINNHLDEWNAIFFRLFARCIPRLAEADAVERVRRAIELPDQSFFEIAADLVPSLDAIYFNGEGASLVLLLKLRAMIGERLTSTDGWRWEGTRNESTVEVHIGPAIGVMFFNHYGSFSGAQAYLKPKGIDRLDPFLGQLEVLISDGPVPFTSQLTMNLLEVAPNAAQLNFFLISALTWLKRQPDNAQLWIDYGLGVRLAKWLDAILESDPSIAAVGRPARPLIDDVLARLVRIGVPGAHELEQKLSHVSA